VPASDASRLLSIGEFAAATQLSPKALRLYDEQRILLPAMVDAGSGYRYYCHDQIAVGRLVRALRDMDLSLAEVGRVVEASSSAEALLRQLAQERERRVARERQALHEALSLLRRASPAAPATAAPEIGEGLRAEATVATRPFLADRASLVERFRSEADAAARALKAAGLDPTGPAICALVDPVTDEEGRAEVQIPIASAAPPPSGIALRHLAGAPCATLTLGPLDPMEPVLAAALDALFDWLERGGHQASEPPTITFEPTTGGAGAVLAWPFARRG
jgi:DNA-binding transcriptional MerR regulator